MIEVENITKFYGQHTALKDVSFTVNDGEILGLLGPNGAGKSTTMNIVTGYISASEGSVKIDGIDILKQPVEARKKIGYLPEIPPLYPDMTVAEYLNFVYGIKKAPVQEREDRLKQVMELVRISDVQQRLIKNLSKGYRQRVGLAQAIIGNPEVLILDEPTVGLDPKEIIEIRNLVKELGKQHTVILSSHILPEISAVCDRVIIINKGQTVASGTPEELSRKLTYSNNILLRVKGSFEKVKEALSQIKDIESLSQQEAKEKNTVDLVVQAKKDKDIREALFNALSRASLPIYMMKSMDLTLEDIFLQVTTRDGEVEKHESHTQQGI